MRIEGRGWGIDRARPVAFRFDGAPHRGFAGDTLASALIGAGVGLVGRSFKYHRPRGVMTLGGEEPNALVTVGHGAWADPNLRATTLRLFQGLEARSQNRWPSLGLDLLALNDLAAPFLGAGFYYKTFMWPRAFWERVYEPAIRRAAGLGALSGEPPAEAYETGYAFCDVLVIGAGPAGLMAALSAAQAGARVILADEGTEPGGRLLFEEESVDGLPAHQWAADMVARLRDLGVRVMTRCTVTGAYDHGTYSALEQVAPGSDPGDLPREAYWRISAGRAVLCAGALERPVAFRDNDRPGVMLAGALRGYLNRYGAVPGRRVAVFGNNDDAHRTARDARAAGLEVVALVDARAEARNLAGDVPFFPGWQVARAHGVRALRALTLVGPGGATCRVTVDALGVSGGWSPSVHLSCHMGARPVWDSTLAAFVPAAETVPGMAIAGAARGRFSTAACLGDGSEAGRLAAQAMGFAGGSAGTATDLPEAEDAPYRIKPLWAVSGKGRAWLDFQNDVTVKDVKQAAAEGYTSVEHMKRYTTQGMATDQGKSSNVGALAVLAEATGRSISETGTTTFRPPYQPVPIAAMGAQGRGRGLAPERRMTSHAASVARDAPMIEAGLWYRPSYFPARGESTWQEACTREVRMVRETVGVCDVSTLGKIELVGPDVGQLLDMVYCNSFSALKPGRVRYGLMLREDGPVMDDGTCARLDQDRWLMTTTTAGAGEVMRHLDWVQQAYLPQARLRFASVTEHWAQFAVAGPRARDVLGGVLTEVPALGFMGCAGVAISGLGHDAVAGRLFRISFSGELGYELAVPARFGAALFERLLEGVEAQGGGPYGMEALNVLRIEKGFVTHAELDGRVTPFDLGMARMIAPGKDCIGKALANRPGLVDEGRQQLVGLRPVGDARAAALPSGAHLFARDAVAGPEADAGWISSTGYSPTLGETRALGFLARGRARHGEVIRAVDLLRGIDQLCEVTDPVAHDPDGGKLRG